MPIGIDFRLPGVADRGGGCHHCLDQQHCTSCAQQTSDASNSSKLLPAIILDAKEHVSLRAPFLLTSLRRPTVYFHSPLCRLSSSSASSFLWRLTRPSLAGRCPAQTLLYYFPILHCFSATRTSRDTLLPIGDMTALKTATPLSPSSPSSPRRYHRHYRQGCHHCHPHPAAADPAKSQLLARTYSVAYAALQLQPHSCSAAVCAKHTELQLEYSNYILVTRV